MKKATETALTEQELHLRTFLHLAILDAKRALAVLDGRMPVVDIKGDKPVPEPTMPKGRRIRFERRAFNKDEEDFLDDGAFKELIRDSVAARVAYRNVMLLRRYGK
jgi:hypothetical protein